MRGVSIRDLLRSLSKQDRELLRRELGQELEKGVYILYQEFTKKEKNAIFLHFEKRFAGLISNRSVCLVPFSELGVILVHYESRSGISGVITFPLKEDFSFPQPIDYCISTLTIVPQSVHFPPYRLESEEVGIICHSELHKYIGIAQALSRPAEFKSFL